MSYLRTRGKFTPTAIPAGQYTHSWNHNGVTGSTTSVVGNYQAELFNGKVMTDVVTPGFKSKMQQGEVVNNPMLKREVVTVTTPASQSGHYFDRKDPRYYGDVLTTGIQITPANPNLPASSCEQMSPNDAINKAFAASKQRAATLLVDAAELGSTVALLKKYPAWLESLLNGTKSGPKRLLKSGFGGKRVYQYKARTSLGKASDSLGLHLEYQYGWVPLVLSIQGVIEALNPKPRNIRNTYRGFDEGVTYALDENVVVSDWNNTHTYSVDKRIEVTYRAGVLAEYNPCLAARLGLELRDVPGTLYDLLPYSFVIDMFYDLSTAIDAAMPAVGYREVASWLVEDIIERTVYTHNCSAGSLTTSTHQFNNEAFVTTYAEVNLIRRRTVGISPAFPKLQGFDNQSFAHITTLAALTFNGLLGQAGARVWRR